MTILNAHLQQNLLLLIDNIIMQNENEINEYFFKLFKIINIIYSSCFIHLDFFVLLCLFFA
jgi:hypothetical protein